MYSAFEYGTRRNTATFWLIIINIAVYVFAGIWSGNILDLRNTAPMIILGQVNVFVWYRLWIWQLFTAMFIHFDIMHLALNMFWLLILGSQYERIFGGISLVKTYILTGLAGNVLSLFLLPPITNSAGASGAVFGIFGALIIIQAYAGGNIYNTIMYGFFIVLLNSIMPGINFIAHAGGFLAGLIIGYLNVNRLRRIYYRVRYHPVYY